jgi:hypothetical protein
MAKILDQTGSKNKYGRLRGQRSALEDTRCNFDE